MGLRPRDLATVVLGQRVALPVLVAPTAFHKLACPEGELATARAARKADTVMVLSSLSNTGVEAVCAAAPERIWFQLYIYRDRSATQALVARAEAAGARAGRDRRRAGPRSQGARRAQIASIFRTACVREHERGRLRRRRRVRG